jgi:hypothetical protein
MGLDLEHARWMAKDEQPEAADSHGTVKLGANAFLADISAYAVKRFPFDDKINAESHFHPGKSVFESAHDLQVPRYGESKSRIWWCPDQHAAGEVIVSIGRKFPGFSSGAMDGIYEAQMVLQILA